MKILNELRMEDLTPEQNYHIKLIETIIFLIKVTNETFTEIVNLAMNGEFNEIDFEAGEDVKFQLAYFRNCKDQNVQLLLKLLDDTQEKINWLVNVNNATEDEFGVEVEF